jgi:hypothetical protein
VVLSPATPPYRPAEHRPEHMATVRPVTDPYRPNVHSVHWVGVPVTSVYRPKGHGSHVVAPADEYKPGPHAWATVEREALVHQ